MGPKLSVFIILQKLVVGRQVRRPCLCSVVMILGIICKVGDENSITGVTGLGPGEPQGGEGRKLSGAGPPRPSVLVFPRDSRLAKALGFNRHFICSGFFLSDIVRLRGCAGPSSSNRLLNK